MSWFKVDDNLHSHVKAMRAGVEAMGLWVLAGSWAADQLTDGWVPTYAAQRLAANAEALASRLVDAGLWHVGSNNGEDGWWFHEWCDRQPTRDEVLDRRQKRAEAGRKGGQRSGQARRGAVEATVQATGEANASASAQAETKQNRTPSRPVPSLKDLSNQGSDKAALDAEFDAFWAVYPRREAKKGSRAKFSRAVKDGTSAEIIVAAAKRYAAYVAAVGREREKIKIPTTWLNQGCWDDELDDAGVTGPPTGDPAEWLRRLWHDADVEPIEKATRIRYQRPNLPDDISDRDAVAQFFRDHKREWITAHREEILARIATKDAA
ncbi:hypothetical protein AB0383_19565 [Amycolatopsis sp. NPDC051373]|uniref:hypothetical protein n=1 Tax=Amycolatopsis sp. NPDC051373 TaxID=3155801 RepID=UPI00344F2303